MATLSSSTLHDATLSKTLIEAKHRLGSVYFEARLIECPKNAIELKKLLKKYDVLEKEYMKEVSEVKRSQQMLSLSLTNYLKSDRPMSSQDIFTHPRSDHLKLPLPPGFRFRCNGEPKQVQIKSVPIDEEGRKCWENSIPWKKQQYAMLNALLHTHPSWNLRNSDDSSTSDNSSTEESGNVLPKEGKNNASLCNARFAFKPGTINFGKSAGKIIKTGTCSRSSLRPACSACQFKLKYSDEALQRIKQSQKDPVPRWQIPPKGIYVKAPFNFLELDRMVSGVQTSRGLSHSSGVPGAHSDPSAFGDAASQDTSMSQKQRHALSNTENRHLASSVALTSVVHPSVYDKYTRHSITNPPYGKQENLTPNKRSTVSFSPSTGNNCASRCVSPPSAVSETTWNRRQTLRTEHLPSQTSTKRSYRHKSVEDWKAILEDERERCDYNVQRFLEKLPGTYSLSVKPKKEHLLPWTRGKEQMKF